MENFVKIISLLGIIYVIGLMTWANRLLPIMESAREKGQRINKIKRKIFFWFMYVRQLKQYILSYEA